jgi:hypothetical protein
MDHVNPHYLRAKAVTVKGDVGRRRAIKELRQIKEVGEATQRRPDSRAFTDDSGDHTQAT